MEKITDKQIIIALGGYQAVADHFKCSYDTVYAWARRRIPPEVILNNMAYFKRGKKLAEHK